MRRQDYKRRRAFARLEPRRKTLQAIASNQNLSVCLRWWAQLEKSKLPRQGSICRVRNHCVETGRSRAVIGFYKISRLQLRRLIAKGVFPGVSKACW